MHSSTTSEIRYDHCILHNAICKPKNRQILYDRIYESLNWGGGFFLFEKTRAPDADSKI